MASRRKHAPAAAAVLPAAKPARLPETLTPVVDYPQQNERVTSPMYTVRVGAPAAARAVDVSINQGAWQACRPAEGYWWFDLSGYDSGEHEIIARALDADGKGHKSQPREFFVSLP